MLFLKALVYLNGMDNAKIFLLPVKGIHNCNIILALPEHKKEGGGGWGEGGGWGDGGGGGGGKGWGEKKKKKKKKQWWW